MKRERGRERERERSGGGGGGGKMRAPSGKDDDNGSENFCKKKNEFAISQT